MNIRLSRLVGIPVFLALLGGPIGAGSTASAAQPAATPKVGMQVIDASYVGVSQPLGALTPIAPSLTSHSNLRTMTERLVIPKTQDGLSSGGFDPAIVQDGPVGNAMPAAIANFEGVNNVSGVLPPDTQGDVGTDPATGKKYYVQWVNLAFRIWDVTNPAAVTSLYGPAAGNTLWAGTGTICAANNDGDPITQFDHLSNRWMMSQFALGSTFHQCIAVSQTADPTGAWYLYDFQTSATLMNDYPHFGVWPDGYYMTVNQFNSATGYSWGGAGVAVFERSAMLAGLAARMIYINTGAITLNYGGMLPSDLDGPGPAAGTPNYFMEWDDSTWIPGDTADTLRIWEFKTDWATPANTTFGLNANFDPNLKITTANVDPDMCGGVRSCIPQPGTTQGLDAIADRLMYRLQYRNFGTHQTLVGNHTVDATSTNKAGIHWFELRNTGGAGFVMHQEGVFAPDADNRWMGSIAMDGSGDIALGYSVSSGTTYPSIRYTGRLAADAPGTLPQGEATLIAGTGSQTHSAARWGDYSMMAVDAADDCTFWYTTEYVVTTGSAPWQTRIGSFKFPSCTTEPTGTISGTVKNAASVPIPGAAVTVPGGYGTLTDAAGHYALTLVAGTYDVTAAKYGYVTKTETGVVVTPPGTTTRNFSLAAAPVSTVSGVVTDATTGWPLYARIDIIGFPGSPIFSNPGTGAYSVPLVNGTYTFTASSMLPGYDPAVAPLVVSGNATRNFGLTANVLACNAPGYTLAGFTENFETWPVAGWTVVDNIVGGGLLWKKNTDYSESNYTGGAGLSAAVVSDNFSGIEYDTELQSPVIDPTALANKTLTYRANYQDWSSYDALDLDIRNVGDAAWTNVSHWTTDHGVFNGGGELVTVDLTAKITGNFQLRWRNYTTQTNPWDWYAQVDEVKIGAVCVPTPSSGLVIGAVFDANTGKPALNASVTDAALRSALMIDAAADPAAPAPVYYVIAQAAGSRTLKASAQGYGSVSKAVTVVAGGTKRLDFSLPAARLSASPTNLSFAVTAAAPTAAAPLSVANNGGLAASYEVFTIPKAFAGYAPVGPFAQNTRHIGPKNINDRDSSALRMDFTPPNIPLINGGAVSASWPTGLTYAWGIGFNTEANNLWLGNIALGGGDNFDYRFTTAGVVTADKIDTSPWVGVFGADMTYNPYTNMLWQVNVGGDNCIHELNPATKLSTGNKICPDFGTSERGLAFDPTTNTFYAGSWNDGIINQFTTDGTIVKSVDVGLNVSGLAINPGTGHLFAMTNGTGAPDVYVLDVNTADFDIVGAFYIKQGTTRVLTGSQAGLEIDCAGNLWAVNQVTQRVYKAKSGETGVCNWRTSWLKAAPVTGSIAKAGSAALTVSVDATGLAPGFYQGYVRIVSNTPYGHQVVPVSLSVNAIPLPSGWVGSAAITSNKSIVAVGRPHVGAEVATYNGFSAGALTAYLPMQFRNAFGGTYNSAFYVQNVEAAGTANIAIKYYTSAGVLTCTVNDTVDPFSSKGYWLPSVGCLTDGWVGGIVVTSDQPIVAIGRPHIGAEVMTYDGFSSGSLASYLPMLFKDASGGTYDAAVYVQNVDAAATATITIKFYDNAGNLSCTKADTIAKLASKGYWLPGEACLPAGWSGAAVVTSNKPVVSVARAHIGDQITTYNGFTEGAGTSYLPMLFKDAFGGSYDSAFYVQNADPVNLATIAIQYFDTAGNLSCTVNDTVAPLGYSGYWVPDQACLPAGWVGSAVVTSDQPIAAVGRPHIGAQVTTYNGFATGNTSAFLPMLFSGAFGGSYNSAYYIQNTESTPATVTIKFYDSTGALTCSRNDSVPARSSIGYWLPSLTCVP